MATEDTYVCEACGRTLRKGWDEKDAQKEMLATFGDLPDDNRAIICDDCYKHGIALGLIPGRS